MPKVLVASPTYSTMEYCLERFLDRIKSLDFPSYDVLLVDNSKENSYYEKLKQISDITVIKDSSQGTNMQKVVSSRNIILDYALENNYDYILMMDQDVIPPKNIISKLVSSGKDIVSGLYFNHFMSSGQMKILPVAFQFITEKEFEEMKKKTKFPEIIKNHLDLRRHLTQDEALSNQTFEVMYPSAGCMLISRKAFTQVRYGLLDTPGFATGDDIYFCKEATKKGFKIYCDTSLKCDHLVSGKFEKSGNSFEHPMHK